MSVQVGAVPHNNFEPEGDKRSGAERSSGASSAPDLLSELQVPSCLSQPVHPEPLHVTFPAHTILGLEEDPQKMVATAPDTVLSKDTGTFGKLVELHAVIDRSTTRLGSAALLRDILAPPSTIEQVLHRRRAIEELRSNESLRDALEEALEAAREPTYHGFDSEELALRFFVPDKADRWAETASIVERTTDYIRNWFNLDRKTTVELKAFGTFLDPFTEIEGVESPLLRDLVGTIRGVRRSGESTMLDGEVQRTLRGVHSPGELPWYMPRICMNGGIVNREVPLVAAATFVASEAIISGAIVAPEAAHSLNAVLWNCMAGYLVVRTFLTSESMQPKLRERIGAIEGLYAALDAVGELDALLTLADLPEQFGSKGSWPHLIAGETYSLRAKGMHHPVLVAEGGSVGNDIRIDGGRAHVLTGPNSGGKTTIVTSILQNQILAQLGTVVAAHEMTVTVADQILFQGPSFAALGDHGRFGTELMATKSIFERATSKSLVVLDEVGDGTTAEERTEMAHAIMSGFNAIGAGTCLVTHNVSLARRLAHEGVAETVQMEFVDGQPTYRLVPGISSASHAESVAKSIGFSRSDIDQMVRRKRGEDPPTVNER